MEGWCAMLEFIRNHLEALNREVESRYSESGIVLDCSQTSSSYPKRTKACFGWSDQNPPDLGWHPLGSSLGHPNHPNFGWPLSNWYFCYPDFGWWQYNSQLDWTRMLNSIQPILETDTKVAACWIRVIIIVGELFLCLCWELAWLG